MSAPVTLTQLVNGGIDLNHVGDIANSTEDTATDRLGNTKRTLVGAIKTIGWQVPVAYTTGLSMTTANQTVVYSGEMYAPKPADLPFTTSGSFETAKFYPIPEGALRTDLASSTGTAFVGHGATTLAAIFERRFYVSAYGAVGDGVTDDYAAIKAAFDAAVIAGGGDVIFTPGKTYCTGQTICPEVYGETASARATLVEAGSATAGEIKNIKVVGNNAKITNDATFTSTFPFSLMGFVGTDNCSVEGLIFESHNNNKVANWLDPSAYFNTVEPSSTIISRSGLIFVNFRDAHVRNCQFLHNASGVVMADDRVAVASLTDVMRSYRSSVTGCRFYNCWQAFSITYGVGEEMLVENNHFEYTFIKTVQETDQGRALTIRNNTFRDIGGILISTNDSQITGNTFNNLLGGIRLQPGGGQNPDVTYSYDMYNTIIKDNILYSDHETVTSAGNKLPDQFVSIVSTAGFTANQQPTLGEVSITHNKVDIWPTSGSTSSGMLLSRAGNSDLLIRNFSFSDNTCNVNTDNGALITLAPANAATDTFLDGKIEVCRNKIIRSSPNGNFEIQLHTVSYASGAEIEISNNYIRNYGTNRQISVENVGKLKVFNNEIIMGRFSSTSGSVVYTQNVPKVDIMFNEFATVGNDASRGYILYYDCSTSGTYSTIIDEAVVRVKDNRISAMAYVFSSPLTFPSSSKGLYEFLGNVSQAQANQHAYPSTITGFTTYNIVNPWRGGTPPNNNGTPSWYTLWNSGGASGNTIGWKWTGATWASLGNHS